MFLSALYLAAIGLFLGLWSSTATRAQDVESYTQQVITEVLDRQWEHKMISSGRNFPSVSLTREHRGDLLVLLHEGIPLQAIRAHFGWSVADLEQRSAALESAGVIRREEAGRLIPTVMVMSVGDVIRHMPLPSALIEDSVDLIEWHLPEVQRLYARSAGLQAIPFETMSLLIVSNVLLDNWQINTVENRFLGVERPLRDGSRYYYSLQEDISWDGKEAFGIYGNQYRSYGQNLVGVYGNRRNDNVMNLIGLDSEGIQSIFGVIPDTVDAFKREALAAFVGAVRGEAPLSGALRSGFESLGWSGRTIPVLSERDEQVLDEMAALLAPDLIGLLERYRSVLMDAYLASPYGTTVSFEEYFMWWYHVYYTEVTDLLIERGVIQYPESGIVSYVFGPSG